MTIRVWNNGQIAIKKGKFFSPFKVLIYFLAIRVGVLFCGNYNFKNHIYLFYFLTFLTLVLFRSVCLTLLFFRLIFESLLRCAYSCFCNHQLCILAWRQFCNHVSRNLLLQLYPIIISLRNYLTSVSFQCLYKYYEWKSNS